jgi:ferric-dicitrate binding protein FerR (iron transport regulator)
MRKAALAINVLTALFSVTVLNPQSASAQNARLVIRSGIVEVQRGNMWLPISVGEALNPGEQVRTANGSTAAIEIGSGKVITLNGQSQVQIGQSNTSPLVQLESGSMKVFSASDIQVAAKDTILQSTDRPVDLELGYQSDQLNLTVFNGSVRSGRMIIHGGNQDPTMRTYSANGRSAWRGGGIVPNPTFYIYPYFLYGYPNLNPNPNAGVIVPPVVNNPTNPGYRPTQIVPPMSDPIRVPVRQ